MSRPAAPRAACPNPSSSPAGRLPEGPGRPHPPLTPGRRRPAGRGALSYSHPQLAHAPPPPRNTPRPCEASAPSGAAPLPARVASSPAAGGHPRAPSPACCTNAHEPPTPAGSCDAAAVAAVSARSPAAGARPSPVPPGLAPVSPSLPPAAAPLSLLRRSRPPTGPLLCQQWPLPLLEATDGPRLPLMGPSARRTQASGRRVYQFVPQRRGALARAPAYPPPKTAFRRDCDHCVSSLGLPAASPVRGSSSELDCSSLLHTL